MCLSLISTNMLTVFAVGTASSFLDVGNSGMENSEITYTIKLKPGLTRVSGAVINVEFDPAILEVKSAGPVYSIDKDGNQINNVEGEYVNGFSKGRNDLYSLAFMNTNGVNTTGAEYKSFFKITFKVITSARPLTSLKFSVKEFFTNDDVNNDIRPADGEQVFKDVMFSTLDNPKPLSTKLLENAIVFNWSAVSGAEEYTVLRKASDEGVWRTIAEVEENVTTYTDENVESGITYTYSVKAGNGYGDSGFYSAGVSQLYLEGATITTISNVNKSVRIMWGAVNGAEHYAVYRQKTGSEEWVLLEKTASSKLYYEDVTVESNNRYNYCVVTENGEVSSVIGAKNKYHKFLGAPVFIESRNAENGVKLSWDNVAGATSYELYRKNGAVDEWSLVTTVSGNSYVDESAIKGSTYIYALKTVGTDTKSSMNSAVTVSRVTPPKSIDFKNSENGIVVSWESVSEAKGYTIYRKTQGENDWKKVGETFSAATTYNDTSAEGGYYTYGVTATLESSESLMTTKDGVIYYLGSPKNIVVKNVNEGIKLSWDTVANATKYKIIRKNTLTGEIKTIGETNGIEYLDKNTVALTSYAYSVVAVDSSGIESKGNAFTLDFCRVAPPKVLSATPETGAITVKWEAVSGVDAYRIYRTTDNNWVKISEVSASQTSFTDTGVNSGTQYKYTITSVKNNSESYIADGNYKSATYVSRPSDITASLTVEGVSLSWETIDKYSDFILYRRVKGEANWIELTKTPVTNTTYHDKAVSSGTVYEYALKAVSADGTFESGLSSIKEVIFLSKIETIKVSSYAGGIKITWSAVKGAEEYAVYRRLSTGNWEVIKTVSSSTLSYKDTKLESGKDYSYTVRALAKGYRSAYQKYDIYYLAAPKITKFDSQVGKGITVKWGAVSGAEKYYLYRKTSGSEWKKIATLENIRYVDKDIKFGKTYYYMLKAYGNGVTSKYYSDGWKCKYAPGVPEITKITNSADTIKIKWSSVSGAEGYKLYRKAENESKYKEIAKIKGTSYTDKNVKKGVKYSYTVKSYKGKVPSDCKKNADFTGIILATPTPTVKNSVSGLKVSWKAVKSAEKYKIYRASYNENTKKWSSFNEIKIVDAKNLSYTDTGLTSGAKYKYKVRALYKKCNSSVKATGTAIYLAITNATVENTENGIKVNWTKVSGGEKYRVYRSEYNEATGKWNSFKKMKTVSSKTLTWLDTTAEEGKTYKYKVCVIKSKTLSSYKSTEKIVCTK